MKKVTVSKNEYDVLRDENSRMGIKIKALVTNSIFW